LTIRAARGILALNLAKAEEDARMERKKAPKWPASVLRGGAEKPDRAAGAARERKELEVLFLDTVAPETVKWLWYPYIPLGKLTLVEGDPGIGKSWFTCALAATLTTGGKLPGQHAPMPPQKVMMVNSEDGLADTMVPRLMQAGADLRLIASLRENIEKPFVLTPDNLIALEEMVHKIGPLATIILDPLTAYLGEKVDMHRANEVRSVMAGLIKLAEHTNCAIVCVRHLRKEAGGKALFKGLGSIDFAASVRSILYVGSTDKGDNCIAHSKCNLAPKGRTMKYEVKDGRFEWKGFCDYSADDLAGMSGVKAKAVDCAVEWLQEFLADGPEPALAGMGAAIAAGHTSSTINRAKRGVVRSFQRDRTWWWTLADAPLPPLEEGAQISG
jgi:AAA domain